MDVSKELKVRNEPICDSQSISSTKRQSILEVKVKDEEKCSATEKFSNKTSIAFLNEETTKETTTSTNHEE